MPAQCRGGLGLGHLAQHLEAYLVSAALVPVHAVRVCKPYIGLVSSVDVRFVATRWPQMAPHPYGLHPVGAMLQHLFPFSKTSHRTRGLGSIRGLAWIEQPELPIRVALSGAKVLQM